MRTSRRATADQLLIFSMARASPMVVSHTGALPLAGGHKQTSALPLAGGHKQTRALPLAGDINMRVAARRGHK